MDFFFFNVHFSLEFGIVKGEVYEVENKSCNYLQDGVFKENIRLVISLPFLFFNFIPTGRCPIHTQLPLSSAPKP